MQSWEQNWILLFKWVPTSLPPEKKNWSICFKCPKRVQIWYFTAFFCVNGKFLEPETFTGVLFCGIECPGKVWGTIDSCILYLPKKIAQFFSSERKESKFHILLLSFVWKVNWLNQKTFTGVSFCDNEEPFRLCAKTEGCFPNKPPKKVDQFLCSRRKVPKFQILFLCFVWEVNYFNQKTFSEVLFCDTEEPCKLWAKTESYFSNQCRKNWSIFFQQTKRV